MDNTQIIGIAAAVCTAISSIPQVVKIWKEKKAENVSILMVIVLTAGLVLWIIYGFKKGDYPIIGTNIFSLLVNIVLIILGVKFKKKGI